MIADDEPDLILLSEVIPKAQIHPISPAMLSLPNYTMYLNFDPSASNLGGGGSRGIGIFVNSKWQATAVSFPNCPFQEQLWIQIPLLGSDQLLVGCIYRSPSANGNSSTSDLIDLLQTSSSGNYSHTLIAGDVNMPQIDWVSNFSYRVSNN